MLGNILFGTQPVEFFSDYPLEESVSQLSSITKRWVFSALIKQQLVGKVSSSKVSVQRIIPFFGNAFKPFFIGTFQTKDGKVVLQGDFTIHPVVKIFSTLWFGFCFCFTLLGVVEFFANPKNAFMVLGGIGVMLLGFALLRFCRWLSRNDVEWISTRITGALSGHEETVITPQYTKTWLGRNWKWAIPAGFVILLIIVSGIFALVTGILKSSSVYTQSLVWAKNNPELVKALGEPIKEGFFIEGNIQISNSSGNADLSFPISGPKGKAIIYVQATKSSGKWRLDTLEAAVDKNNERINLLNHKTESSQ